jgi:hypothetical protein
MQSDGVYEIREFIDENGATTGNEIHNVKQEFQDLQAQFDKIRKTTGSEAPDDAEVAKQNDVSSLLEAIGNDMDLTDDDKNSVENIGEDMAFVRELAKLHVQSGRSAETDALANLEKLAASEVESIDREAAAKKAAAAATKKNSGGLGSGGGWKKGFLGGGSQPKKAAAPAAAPTPPAVAKSVRFHEDIENSASPEPARPAVMPPAAPEPEVSFHTDVEKNAASDPASGFKVTEEPKKRPAAFSGKIVERF